MRRLRKNIILLFLLAGPVFCINKVAAQEHGEYDTIRVEGFRMPSGEIIASIFLPPVTVEAKLTAQQKKYWVEWTRLRNAVYVTYPYAKAAGRIMNEINTRLVNVTDKKERRVIIRSREKELKKEFTDKLTKLSIYQGKVLMKLINRETGNNCYEIVEEYKGYLTAAFYQGVAFIFGTSLKQSYDAKGSERDMETIVHDVEKMYGWNRGT